MTDVGTGFLQAISAFGATRLGHATETSWKDTKSLVATLGDGLDGMTKPAWEQLKADIEAEVDLIKPIIKKVDSQLKVIAKMASDSAADAGIDPFTVEIATRIATRIGTALVAIDEAFNIVATDLATTNGNLDTTLRDHLMGIWNPWAQPFKNMGADAGKLIDAFGKTVFNIDHTTKKLGDQLTFGPATGEPGSFRLAARLTDIAEANFGVLRLNQTVLEAFVSFSRREFLNPTDEEKKGLIERDNKWWRADQANFGFRVYTAIRPGIQQDPLLSKIMPGSQPPSTIKPSAVTLDSTDGFYFGDGPGAGNEKIVLPVQFDFPAVDIREFALGLVRNQAHEVTGLEVTTIIAAKIGDVLGLQVVGAGVTIALDGQPPNPAIFPWVVSPRWPDAVGIRVKASVIKGGGYLERKQRKYGNQTITEFSGVLQLEILKVGVFAIGILSPDPFSLVLVMGVRFPTAIELTFGFTLNGVGGMLALNRTVDTDQLVAGMKNHFIDRVLFPDDPMAEAPKLLDQVANVFPYHKDGFVVGPIVELGWGSQAKIVEAKLGIVLALPDPKIILLGAVRVRAPAKDAPLTDFRCEVYGEISADRLLIIASLHDSKIAGINVSGDMGLLIQWGGGGAFALSVGGFHPSYKAEVPPALAKLDRLTMDMSAGRIVKITVQAYFAVTAGAVMAGVRGDLKADVGVASAHAWLQLDMIFRWVPHFGFEIDIAVGIEIEVFGCSFASISLSGKLQGTRPWSIEGTATVDVWFLPTFHFDLGPVTWGEPAVEPPPKVNVLAEVKNALDKKESWKALLPLDGDMLAVLGRVDDDGIVAHPLAVLEVSQTRVPLETHIDRLGSAEVSANRLHLGLPSTSIGTVGAVSTVTAPFSPGQFLALTGEALLSKSGFENMPNGCRMATSTTPSAGASKDGTVRWRTYFHGYDKPAEGLRFKTAMFNETLVGHSLISRGLAERDNPYLSRQEKVNPDPSTKPSVSNAGIATVRRVDDGTQVLADLGELSAAEASRVAEAVNLSGAGNLTAVAVGAM